MPYLPNGESTLYYESTGSGDALVFLHGGGGNHASFFYQIAALSDRYRVVTYDARGFGNSTDTENLGRAGHLPDLLLIFNSLGIDRAFVIAQSMGGEAAVAMTCEHPERVRGLVMADTLLGIALPTDLMEKLAVVRKSVDGLSQTERVLGATTRRSNPIAAMLYGQLASFNAVDRRTMVGQPQLYSLEALAAAGPPVLFIVGSEDVLCPPAFPRETQKRLAGSTFIEIPGAGHSAYFERADEFNAALTSWLELHRG